jgi:two-component system, cell cycle sensor histidine kinase and response regulator CckA
MLRRLIGEDVELITDLRGVYPVKADPGQMEQVLMNLAVNARDAMPDGGTIEIRIEDVTLTPGSSRAGTPMDPGEYVLLRFSDTGVGMDAATQARIFEPFFTTKDASKGTGLGLSTVYGIIKQSGGYVFVESSPGEGTTFLMYFPRVNEPVVDLVIPAAPVVETGTETILVVEDEENVRTLLAEMLRRKRYNVLEAGSGPEALAVCEKHAGRIDLLMTDIVIPGMRGPEIAQQLRGRYPGLKVLFMSGYMEEASAIPADAFLQKPFTMSSLAAKVREVLAT